MTKNILLLVAVLSAFAGLAFADPVKLKFNAVADLSLALQQLDGYEKPFENVVVDPKSAPATRILRVPYDFKTSVRIALAKNISAVKVALEGFEQTRQVLLAEVSSGAPEKIQSDPALLSRFTTKWNAAANNAVTLDLTLIADDELNLDKNKDITGTVLSALSPIIKTK